MSEQTPGTVELFLATRELTGGPAKERENVISFLRAGFTERIRAHDAEDAAMRAALERIVKRCGEWLSNDHDYSTAYADRPEGDRAANEMLTIARAALEGRVPAKGDPQ